MQNKNLPKKTEKIGKKDFDFLMVRLATAFKEPVDMVRILLYYGYLNHLTREKLSKVVDTIILESKFFPKVSEILEVHRRLSNVEYDVLRIEYKEKQISPEEAKKILAEIYQKLGGRSEDRVVPKPKLEGKRAEEFEKKRRLAKEKLRVIQ